MSSLVRVRSGVAGPSDDAKARSVAVTGASGFLGRNLIGALERDPRVARIVAIDVKPARAGSAGGDKTRWHEVDLTHPATETRLAGVFGAEHVDTVAHLAFLSSPTHATAWAHEVESVGTMHVTVAARHARVRKFVLWSQTWLYGARPTNPNFLTEKHPLRAASGEAFFADKIQAEEQVRKLAQRAPGVAVTILRTAPILGPTIENTITRYLSGRWVPTMMGFDPLVQFLHEADAIAALQLAVLRDVSGTFNVVGSGVLSLSAAIKLAGRVSVPIPHPIAETLANVGWAAQFAGAPPSFLKYLRFLCIADGRKANDILGFLPTHSTRDAVLDFGMVQRLRDANLLSARTA